eukprot:TRINITY_DN4602_c0_g1_i1.p1 TRINITY_DN4602_c0_g1~~TRINITY_DN4602_c0_g1_i1.p1  ORF type:complete len:184 (-),score=24.97 TRINITY_DN4602_c0_g1_i1:181-732(-)
MAQRRQAQAVLYAQGQKAQYQMANYAKNGAPAGGQRGAGYPAMSRCARHVAIAYHIYYRQNSEQVEHSKKNLHNSAQQMAPHLDPTLEARRLKERTEWLKRSAVQFETQEQQPTVAQIGPYIQSFQVAHAAAAHAAAQGQYTLPPGAAPGQAAEQWYQRLRRIIGSECWWWQLVHIYFGLQFE